VATTRIPVRHALTTSSSGETRSRAARGGRQQRCGRTDGSWAESSSAPTATGAPATTTVTLARLTTRARGRTTWTCASALTADAGIEPLRSRAARRASASGRRKTARTASRTATTVAWAATVALTPRHAPVTTPRGGSSVRGDSVRSTTSAVVPLVSTPRCASPATVASAVPTNPPARLLVTSARGLGLTAWTTTPPAGSATAETRASW